jgi:serine-type D-Ala-D-Ala carboxypeptidase (penicillin-binding protein 5/6)
MRRGMVGILGALALAPAVVLAGAPALAHATAGAVAPPAPAVVTSARAAVLIESGSGQELYGSSADSRRPIASATKLMTALVTLEHVHRLGTIFTQNDYIPGPEDSQIGLAPGERMSVHDLMLALLLPSADDAAEDLAYNVGHGSVARFVGMMNARARELGLHHTHYSTPIGLDTPGNYSSASDLVKLARYVLHESPFFKRVVALRSAVVHTGRQVRSLVNRNDLVGKFPWINGVKTGHTLDAGYVLIGSATRDGMTLLSAVLGTPSEAGRDASTLALLNYGFDNFRPRTPIRKGTVLARPAVHGRGDLRANAVAARTFSHVFPRRARVHLRVGAPDQVTGPLRRGAIVGAVAVVAGRKVVARVPLVLAGPVPAPQPAAVGLDFITRPVTLVAVVVLIATLTAFVVFRRGRIRGKRAEPA